VAQALYAHSQRSKGPFIKVNCAAVPQELMEAEFFGCMSSNECGPKLQISKRYLSA